MFNKHKNRIVTGLVIFSFGVALSACSSSSSSSSSEVPAINYAHNLVFKNGTLLSTGYNAFGQLGNNTTDSRNVPGALAGGNLFTGFATGGNHSVAFTANGEVFSWGNNVYGQLGNSATTNSSLPVKSAVSDVKAVAAGALHTLALGGDGSVWGWGWNNYGQLGYAVDSGYSALPAKIVFSNASTNVSALAANGYNSMALANGAVWTWGLNGTGQLGYNPAVIGASQIPLPVLSLPAGITAIASGSAFSYAIASDTTVWAWGNNSNGQLGNGTVLSIPNSGTDIPGGCEAVSGDKAHEPDQVRKDVNRVLTNVVQVAAGFHHGLARLADGTVWAWGANVLGQLGNQTYGGNNCYAVQVKVKSLDGTLYPLLAGGIRAFGSSSLAMTADGAWYAWGNNLQGQLGIGSNDTALYPVKLSGF